MCADCVADDRACRLPQQDLARRRRLLQPRGDAAGAAEEVGLGVLPARRQHLTRVQSGAGRELDSEDRLELLVQLGQLRAYLDGCQHCAQGVVLVRDGCSEDRNDPLVA